MLKLRGAETVIVGIQPDVASRWCNGIDVEGVGTALDLEEGWHTLISTLRERATWEMRSEFHRFGHRHRDARQRDARWRRDSASKAAT